MDQHLRPAAGAAATPWRWPLLLLVSVVLLASTAFPRLMVIGGLPTTDEGYQAYVAQSSYAYLKAGRGLEDEGPVGLYPILLSWVFATDVNPMILLRAVDLAVALVAGLLLFRVLERESGMRIAAAWICAVFLFTMNQVMFIQYGFKNSITAAFVPLLLALRIGQEAAPDDRRAWSAAGALTAIAVILREPFVAFALLGLVAVFIARGRRAAQHFTLGGTVAGLAIMGLVFFARGGVLGTLEGYRSAGIVYAAIANQRVAYFLNSGAASAGEAAVALTMAVAALVGVAIAMTARRRARDGGRLAFWLAAATLPLIEPCSKIGFPYHFAVCLPGLAGLCALAWREVAAAWPGARPLLHAACALGVLMLATKSGSLLQMWPATRAALAEAPSGSWPLNTVEQSNYLLAANAIRKVIPPEGSLSVSGFMFALYPLTGRLPNSPGLANLSATLIKLDLSADRLREALERAPPDVVMTTTRMDWPGGPELLAAVRATNLYEEVAVIPTSAARVYGGFGGIVFRRKELPPAPSIENAPSAGSSPRSR